MLKWLFKINPHCTVKSTPPTQKVCAQCHSTQLKRKLATYPVQLDGKLKDKRIDVYRVELDRCRQCGHLMPTKAGAAKVKRCVKKGTEFFLKYLP